MKYLVMAILGLSVFQASADTTCSTAEQNLTYNFSVYGGGMPPMHGDVLSSETLVYNGTDYGQNQNIKGLDYRPQFSIEFDGSTKMTLSSDMDINGSKEVYTILVKSISSSPLGLPVTTEVNQFVICSGVVTAIP